jgi:hypothetical protein
MEAVSSRAQQARANHRHDLRTLTYVILDEANGGVIRNLNHQGVAVQAVAALRPQQLIRLRFELRHPRLRVEARGEVMWANVSGQCGVRFVDLPPRMVRQINEWIFGNLLETIPQHGGRIGSIFGSGLTVPWDEHDGLLVSPFPRKVIPLIPRAVATDSLPEEEETADWLSRPLSARSLAWIADSLIMIAAFLLFSVMFLGVTHELPRWPLSLEVALGAAIFIPAFYCSFSYAFGGASLGARLARLAGSAEKDDVEARDAARFR